MKPMITHFEINVNLRQVFLAGVNLYYRANITLEEYQKTLVNYLTRLSLLTTELYFKLI